MNNTKEINETIYELMIFQHLIDEKFNEALISEKIRMATLKAEISERIYELQQYKDNSPFRRNLIMGNPIVLCH